MRKWGILIFLVFFGKEAIAQESRFNPFDTLRYYTNLNKPSFRIGLDGKTSIINGKIVPITGGRVGFDYGKIRIFSGVYFLGAPVQTKYQLDGKDTLTQSLDFQYFSGTVEWALINTYRWEVVIPLQVGSGWGKSYELKNGEVVKSTRANIFPMDLSVYATYRFSRYVGIGAGLGWRVSLANTSKFNGSFYSIGFAFYTGTLYRDIKKKLHL